MIFNEILIETILKDAGANSISFEQVNGKHICVVNNYTSSFMIVDEANRSLESLNIRLVQRVKENDGVRKDLYEMIDISNVQRVKDICIKAGCQDNFRIDTTTVWGDNDIDVNLRYDYWRKLDTVLINPLLEILGVKIEIDSFDDDDCGVLYTNRIINL